MRNVLFAIAATAACSTSMPTDTSDQLDAPVGKADAASRPSGTYTNAAPQLFELVTLTLAADHTFTRTRMVACAHVGACEPITETGTYLMTHGRVNHYIRFYNDDGAALDRYEWTLGHGELDLTLVGTTDEHTFAMHQGNACQSAGGTCVPLVPDACEFGTVADATQYSCGGGLGVECCMPLAHDNSCTTASDCTGFLPQFCRQCGPDGSTTACAHWECVSNACAIVSCPQ